MNNNNMNNHNMSNNNMNNNNINMNVNNNMGINNNNNNNQNKQFNNNYNNQLLQNNQNNNPSNNNNYQANNNNNPNNQNNNQSNNNNYPAISNNIDTNDINILKKGDLGDDILKNIAVSCKRAFIENQNPGSNSIAENISQKLKQEFNKEWFVIVADSSNQNFDFKFSLFSDENILVLGYQQKEIYIHSLL